MSRSITIRSRVTALQAQKELAGKGMDVSLEQAAAMVELLSKFALITLENEDSLPIRPRVDRRASR
jgi:hypothetical protein